MQDDQINWLKTMQQSGMHVVWQDAQGDCQAVLGFSSQRPHIIFVATSIPLNHKVGAQKKDSIVEKDIRTLSIGDFIVLNQIPVPLELRDPVFMKL